MSSSAFRNQSASWRWCVWTYLNACQKKEFGKKPQGNRPTLFLEQVGFVSQQAVFKVYFALRLSKARFFVEQKLELVIGCDKIQTLNLNWPTPLASHWCSWNLCLNGFKTRSSWLNCALRDDKTVYWVSIGHYEEVAVDNWWYWVIRGHFCLYTLHKVEIWTGVRCLTHFLTDRLWKIELLSSL